MNLHRSGLKPDWDLLPRERWNRWQKLAADTHGIVTIGNAITILGFVGVLVGLYLVVKQHYSIGLGLLGAGRFCDLLDGWLAEKTGTKSPLGEQLDAGFDKLGTVVTIITFLVIGIAPVWVAVMLSLPQIAIATTAYVAIRRGRQFPPSAAGKISMALIWLAFGGFVVLRLAGWDSSAGVTWLAGLVYLAVAGAVLAGWTAFRGYIRQPT